MKTTERTIDRPRVERPIESDTKRRSVIRPIAMVVAVLLGLLAGFLVWGTDDTNSTAPVAAGGSELTTRQEQMVDLVDEYVAAWQAGDGEAVAAMFTENGAVYILGTEFPVEDGALIDYVNANPYPTLDLLEPVLVSDNGMLNFHTLGGSQTLSNVFEFTADGELLIISHEMLD